MFDTILTALGPHLAELLGFALLALFGLIAQALRRTLGLQAEAIWRDALHSALESGAMRADTALTAQAVEQAVDYARRSVPDAIRNLGATDDVLRDLAGAKVRKVAGLASGGR